MCVIATKDIGYVFPDEATLKRCFTANPDGAGFAWSDDKKVYWKKGFTTFETFYTSLKTVFPTEESEKLSACIMHFRIGTHGPKKSLSHTHPFPVDAESIQDTCALEGSSSMVLFHNGILSDIAKTKHDKVIVDNAEVDPSDSQIFTQYYVNPMFKALKTKAFSAETFNNMMLQLISTSKIALLSPKGKMSFYGYWAVEDKDYPGCWFSNTTYKEYKTPVVKSSYYDDNYLDYDDAWDSRPIGKIAKAPYWEAYDGYFKKYPNASMAEFNTYWANTQKSASKKVKSTTAPTLRIDAKFSPFWEKHSEVAFMGKNADFRAVPPGTVITLKKNTVVSYMPTIDGELYYWSSQYKQSLYKTDYVYVREVTNGVEKFYYVGSYVLEEPKGVKANV